VIGATYKKLGTKVILAALMIPMTIVSFTCFLAVKIPVLYFLCVLINYYSVGGIFATIPTAVQNVFGLHDGPQIYVFVILASFLCAILNIFASQYLLPATSYEFVFLTGGVVNVTFLIVLIFYQEKLDVDRLARHNALVPEKQRIAELAK